MKSPNTPPQTDFSNVQSSDLISLSPLDPPQSSDLISSEPLGEPSFTYTTPYALSQAHETLERIALGLPVRDDQGNYFPPTIRSDKEKELLRELSQAKRRERNLESHARYLERQVMYAKIEANCAKANALIARSRYYDRPGLLSGLISTLTLGIF